MSLNNKDSFNKNSSSGDKFSISKFSGGKFRAAFHTLGCKVNQQETDQLITLFIQHGCEIVPFDNQADIYVINTCTVTALSDKKSRQMISKAHTLNPDADIVVMGCYSQREPELIKDLPGVKIVVGTQHKDKILDLIKHGAKRSFVEDINNAGDFEQIGSIAVGERTRTQFKVQDGCENFCSYCIIPYVRGPLRSLPLDEVKKQLNTLSESGVSELVLTGIHLMSYGKDANYSYKLTDIIEFAANKSGIGRVRLGSLDPSLIDEGFVNSLKQIHPDKLCAQFHLSLQSGSDAVLKRMNRKYTTTSYSTAVGILRQAIEGCAITTDIIAGFPGETDQEHNETLEFIKKIQFARAHVFPYSRREGTVAYSMQGQIEKSVREKRAKELTNAAKRMELSYLQSQINTVQQVLVEKCENGRAEGYSGNYIRVAFNGEDNGGLQNILITGINGFVLEGQFQ